MRREDHVFTSITKKSETGENLTHTGFECIYTHGVLRVDFQWNPKLMRIVRRSADIPQVPKLGGRYKILKSAVV